MTRSTTGRPTVGGVEPTPAFPRPASGDWQRDLRREGRGSTEGSLGTTAEPGEAACSGLRAAVTLATGAVTCNDGLDGGQVVGDDVVRSGRSKRSPRWGGSSGRRPVASSTASGNLPGWAVASATVATPGSRAARAAPIPTAVWGSTSSPVSSCTARMMPNVSGSSKRAPGTRGPATPRTGRPRRPGDRWPAAGAAARPSCRRPGRSPRRAGARSSTRPGCPCSGSASARRPRSS